MSFSTSIKFKQILFNSAVCSTNTGHLKMTQNNCERLNFHNLFPFPAQTLSQNQVTAFLKISKMFLPKKKNLITSCGLMIKTLMMI